MELELLVAGCAGLGVTLTRRQLQQFAHYRDLLLEWNQRMNLTSITDDAGIQVRHFLDSLSGLALLPLGPVRMVDVGSGAGFPGIVLKIARSDLDVTVLEATGKKCLFLDEVIGQLRLTSVTVINKRAELQGQIWGDRERYDVAVARAVAAVSPLLELTLPFVKVGGVALCWKKQEIEAEVVASTRAARTLGGGLPRIVPTGLPGLEGHVIVSVAKVAPTPATYPRRPGIPERQPLR